MPNDHGDCKSPRWGCSPSKWHKMAYRMGFTNLLTNWDDPPSSECLVGSSWVDSWESKGEPPNATPHPRNMALLKV